MTTQPQLFETKEHLSPREIQRRAEAKRYAAFKEAKGIRTHRCEGANPDWSAWYGVDCPMNFCAMGKTPDGKVVGYYHQTDCYGYGETEREAVQNLVDKWPHLGCWNDESNGDTP